MKKILLLVLVAFSFSTYAQNIPDPVPNSYVHDFANLLKPGQIESLNQKIRDIKSASTIEIALVTIPSLGGTEIADYGVALGRKWGVGGKSNNGIVILHAPNERKWRIDVGYGLEGDLPDITTKQLANIYLVPHLKDETFAEGYGALIDELWNVVNPQAKAIRAAEEEKEHAKSKAEIDKMLNIATNILIFLLLVFGLGLTLFLITQRISKKKEERRKELEKLNEVYKEKFEVGKKILNLAERCISLSYISKENRNIAMNIISDYHYFSNKFIPFKDPATKEVYEFDFKVIDKKHISTLNSFIDFDTQITNYSKDPGLSLPTKLIELEKNILSSNSTFSSYWFLSLKPDFTKKFEEAKTSLISIKQEVNELVISFRKSLENKNLYSLEELSSKLNSLKAKAEDLNNSISYDITSGVQQYSYINNFGISLNSHLGKYSEMTNEGYVTDNTRKETLNIIERLKHNFQLLSNEKKYTVEYVQKLQKFDLNVNSCFSKILQEKKVYEDAIEAERKRLQAIENEKRRVEEERQRKIREEEALQRRIRDKAAAERRRQDSYNSSSYGSSSSSYSSSSDSYSGGSFGGGGSDGSY